MNISPFQPGDKVVAYCRYSGGEEQGLKNTSTDEQEAAIKRFCEQNGLDLVKVYADPFVSGRSTKGRDHYLEMMSDLLHVKKGIVKPVGIVVWDWERMHRNVDQAMLDASRLRMAGYKIFSLQQPIVDSGPFARVMEAMYMASAQNQSDMISADVKRALQHNFMTYKVIPRSCIGFGWIPEPVDMGKFSDGSQRIGYRAVPDPEKADSIRLAVKARLEGASYSQCRQIIGNKSNLNIKRLFQNPLLTGRMTYGAATIENYCEPILDCRTFDALQAFESSHPGRQIGRQGGWSPNPPMLSGLLYCAECGSPMYITRREVKGHLYCTYRCQNRCYAGVKQDILEPFILDLCCDKILTEENVHIWLDRLSESDTTETAQAVIGEIEKELAPLERRISTAVDLLLDHPSEALTKKLSEMESRRDELKNRLKSLTEQDSAVVNIEDLYKSTLEMSARIRSVLRSPDASDTEKRSSLSSFVRSIVVSENHYVSINYSPPGFKVGRQHDIVPPSLNKKMSGVGSQSAHNTPAPPEGDYSETQLLKAWK